MPTANAQERDDSVLRILVTSTKDGNSVVGANALLTPTGPDTVAPDRRYAGVTDTDGYHQFNGVEAGPYQLRISFVGHETYTQTVSLSPGERIVERVALKVKTKRLD